MPNQPDPFQTARLTIRKPTAADAIDVLAILSDPLVVKRNPSDLVTDPTRVDALIERWLRHWDNHGFGNSCVFESATGLLVGTCGIRTMTVQGQPVLNLMYRFRPPTWGQGYATEAAGAVVTWSEQTLPGQVVVARVRPEHLASQRVATKIGLRRDSTLDDVGDDGLDWAFSNRPAGRT